MQALLENMKSGQVAAYDVPAPELQPGGLLVRTAFSAISAGTEKATIQGVRQTNVTFGETVAVIGAGLVGVLTMQVLRAAGCRVIAIDLSRDGANRAAALGAHLGLSTTDPSLEGAVAAFSRYGVDAALITAATRSAEPLDATGLPDSGRYSGDTVTVTISFADGSVASLLYLANGDKAVGKEYVAVFCGGAVARLDDFKTLSCSRHGKTETLKSRQDKGHRRELELTVEALKQGTDAPIPFAELCEVTRATFAMEEAIRTQRVILI